MRDAHHHPPLPRAVEIVPDGRFTGADVAPALDRRAHLLDGMPQMDVLADVRGAPSIALSAIGEEIRRFPLVFWMIP
jgi:hypothetical protein